MQQKLALAGGTDSRPSRNRDRYPSFVRDAYALDENEIIVDSFAGAGGMSIAIEMATGRSPDIAINHDEVAICTHEANHPDTQHYHASVYAVNPEDAVPEGKSVGIFWASPDCFVSGTLVLTKNGLMPIESIQEGDIVLTHKGRWRQVTKTWSQKSDVVEVKGYGHYGLITTPKHAFYSKRITTRWPGVDKKTGKRPGGIRKLVENPYWPEAVNMPGKLWATPRNIPAQDIPVCPGAEFSDDFFYFLGRWLGDGSMNKGDVEICAGKHEAAEIEKHFTENPLRNHAGEVTSFRTIDRNTTVAFVWGNASLQRWLKENMGHLSHNKMLPIWCLAMQKTWREALLKGYLDADGHNDGRRTSASSVSKSLAIGMRLLATSLGHAVSMMKSEGAPNVIEGRTVLAKDRYHIAWTTNPKNETTFSDTIHQYTPVRSVEAVGKRQVFCLQVEEDESFVADGIVVHNCRSHSRARGAAPKSKSVRDLAWVVVHWAERVRPRIIGVENVAEIMKWGPLDENGKPIKKLEGTIFKEWCDSLRALGYELEWRVLNAADYGAPTTRVRFFLQARCDGLPILWPEESHGAPTSLGVRQGSLEPWRTASECIEYERKTHSIFLTAEQAKKVGCKRPLAEKTERRIAKGMFRHVVNNPEPFILNYYGERRADDGFRGTSLRQPFATATTENRFGLVVPLTHQGDDRSYTPHEPFRTVTGANRGEMAWVAPYFARTAHGEQCAKGKKRGKGDHGPGDPYPTVTASNDSALICPTLIQTGYGEREGQQPRALSLKKPLGTVVAGGAKHAMVAAHLTCMNQNAAGSTPKQPLKTVMAGATRHVLIDAEVEGGRDGVDRSDQVAEFLWKYRHLSDVPVTRDEVGTLLIDGIPMRITDIGLRMLVGTELARAQGFDLNRFDPTQRVVHNKDGTTGYKENTGTQVVRMIGNSVAPPVGCAVIRAMLGHGISSETRKAA